MWRKTVFNKPFALLDLKSYGFFFLELHHYGKSCSRSNRSNGKYKAFLYNFHIICTQQCRIYHCAQGTVDQGAGATFLSKSFFTMDFCLCGAILDLQAFCFGAIPDIMIELIVYGSVQQSKQSWKWFSGIQTTLLGGLWILVNMLRWIHAYVVQFWIEKDPSECQHWDGRFTNSKRA